jgi:hypothetical protein
VSNDKKRRVDEKNGDDDDWMYEITIDRYQKMGLLRLLLLLLLLQESLPLRNELLPTFQLHVVQSTVGGKILLCGGLVTTYKEKQFDGATITNLLLIKKGPKPLAYPLSPGKLSYMYLLNDQHSISSRIIHHVIFEDENVCHHFILSEYVLSSPGKEDQNFRPHIPPLSTTYILPQKWNKNDQSFSLFTEKEAEIKVVNTNIESFSDTSSAAKKINAGARKVWKQVMDAAGIAPNMTTSPLVGERTNYGLQNISKIISLVQTHIEHHKNNEKQSSKIDSKIDSKTASVVDGNDISTKKTDETNKEVFERANPFTHTAMFPTSKKEPCVSPTMAFINCVKRHANVKHCNGKKMILMKCKKQHETISTAPDGFSFRACTGVDGKCPASGGTPDGAVAKELGVPAQPPQLQPTPLGPDLSDTGKLVYFFHYCEQYFEQ